KAYLRAARERALQHLIQELKVALEQKDSARAASLQRRLLQLDPQRPEVSGLSQVLQIAKERSAGWQPKARRRRAPGQRIYVAIGATASLGLALAGYFAFFSPLAETSLAAPLTPPEPSAPSAAEAPSAAQPRATAA